MNRIGFLTRFFLEDENQGRIISKLIKDDFKKLHDGDVHDSNLQYISRFQLSKDLIFQFNNNTKICQIEIYRL